MDLMTCVIVALVALLAHGATATPVLPDTLPSGCADLHDDCPGWAEIGECTANPSWMHAECPRACGQCDTSQSSSKQQQQTSSATSSATGVDVDARGRHAGLFPIGVRHAGPIAAVPAVDGPMGPRAFAARVAAAEPVLLRGLAARATRRSEWTEAFLAKHCAFEDGRPWIVTVAGNPDASYDWSAGSDFCTYLAEGYGRGAYLVQSLDDHAAMRARVALPGALRCAGLQRSVEVPRLWLSGGGTWSSLHFDYHDSILMQLEGTKVVTLLPPNAAHAVHMDDHPRDALHPASQSPVNPQAVDTARFPRFADAPLAVATLRAGDAIYIPGGHWHAVESEEGRNVAISVEFWPYGFDHLEPGPDSDAGLRARYDAAAARGARADAHVLGAQARAARGAARPPDCARVLKPRTHTLGDAELEWHAPRPIPADAAVTGDV